MGQKVSTLSKLDSKLVQKYKDKGIQQHITTKLEFNIGIAGTEFTNIEEAILYAYRCGLAVMSSEQSKRTKEDQATVDQDELYGILKHGSSIEHKADFLREIAKEWFPIDLHSDKKVKTVHIELNELADFLEK